MSHTVQGAFSYPVVIESKITIVDYATGGESVNPREVGLTSVDGLYFAIIPPTQNLLGKPLLCSLIGGRIVLAQVIGGVISEIPPTIGLNATVRAITLSESLASKLV